MKRFPFFPVLCAIAGAGAFALGTLDVHAQSTAVPAGSTTPVVYPAKGQSKPQQDKDRYECYDWARSQSGFDPAAAPQGQPQPAPPQQTQQAGGGNATNGAANGAATMARGAMGGAAVAELTNHDAGRGAATGVVGATIIDRVRQQQVAARQQASQQQASQQQQAQMQQMQQQKAQQRATYDRAFGACLEGRGYTVK